MIELVPSPDTVERLRNRVGWVADVNTPAEWESVYGSIAVQYERIDKLVTVATVFLLVVIGANCLVAAVDWIIERRRALAVLSAVGAGLWQRANREYKAQDSDVIVDMLERDVDELIGFTLISARKRVPIGDL